MTTWTHPEWLVPALAAVGAVALLVGLADWRGRRAFRRLVGAARGGWPLRDLALLAALAALAIGLAGPKLGFERITVPASGIDVVVLVDVSRSMDARDVLPTRLARARRAASEILGSLRSGDRAALAIFGGEAALLTPLTPDLEAIRDLLGAVRGDLMNDRGSDAAEGVEIALAGFGEALRPRALLVLSDGEWNDDPSGALGALRDASVRVVGVALGSDAGTTIRTSRGDLQDRYGEVVVTRRDPGGLAALADGTGGALFAADEFGSVDPDAVRMALEAGGRATVPGGEVLRRIPVARAWIPAAIALALLVGEWAGPWALRALRSRRALVRTAAMAGAVAFTLAASPAEERLRLEARIADDPDDPAGLIALGIARARAGAVAEAERAFLAASLRSKDPELAALALYDLGVVALEAGDPERAIPAFYDAIALDPELREARFNLEFALARAAETPPEPPPEQPSEAPPPDEEANPRPDDAEPDTAPTEEETPSEEAAPEPSRSERIAPPRQLGEEEAEQWLEQIDDDPTRGLRDAIPQGEATGGEAPRW